VRVILPLVSSSFFRIYSRSADSRTSCRLPKQSAFPAVCRGEPAQEVIGQQWNIFAPFAQWRHEERDDVQAIEQVLVQIANSH
jgi:hypothetical protein